MDSQNIKDRIQLLAVKLQDGTITEEEEKEFELWYNSYDDSSVVMQADEDIDVVKERIYASVEKQTIESVGRNRSLWLGWLQVAAAMTVCALAVWFYASHYRTPPNSLHTARVQEILPCGQRAVSILSDGSKVVPNDKTTASMINPIYIPKGGTYFTCDRREMFETYRSSMSYLQTAFRSSLFSFSMFSLIIFASDLTAQHTYRQQSGLRMLSRKVSSDMPHIHGSIYTDHKALSLRSGDFISVDNGESWIEKPLTPDFALGLPFGFRRDLVASLYDSRNGRILAVFNSLDLENLDPGIREPPVAQKSYYLRYRVSDDGGKTWKFDEPIVQKGDFTAKNPLPGVFIGKNSIYVGDRGSKPLVTRKGKIIVPAQTTILGENGELFNPGNGHTYTDAVVLIGSWSKDNKIAWEMSDRIIGDPKRSTRGMIEPTVIELQNGDLVVVMRGSNEQKGSKSYTMPSYKWLSISKNGGKSWTRPEPLAFEGGKELFSPSSMSTLFKHSSGRCFWIGNRTPENNQGSLPRWPLVCAELNTKDLKLISSSVLVLDTQEEADKPRGRLDISHVSVVEDQKTKEIIITYPRSYNAYKSQEWVTTRITIN